MFFHHFSEKEKEKKNAIAIFLRKKRRNCLSIEEIIIQHLVKNYWAT